MQRLKLMLLALAVSLTSLGGLSLATASAAVPVTYLGATFQSDACDGLSQLDSSQACGGGGQTAITKVVKAVLQILSILLGVVGVIMVIVSGFRYITSGGDSGGVASAKRTLIYALVGLAIAALSEFLVHFVINQARAAG